MNVAYSGLISLLVLDVFDLCYAMPTVAELNSGVMGESIIKMGFKNIFCILILKSVFINEKTSVIILFDYE